MRRLLRGSLVVLALLVLAGGVGYRLWRSDQQHSIYCRLVGCAGLRELDRLCSLFAEAEYVASADPVGHVRAELSAGAPEAALLTTLIQRPGSERAALLAAEADRRGGAAWTCPSMVRVLSSTVAR